MEENKKTEDKGEVKAEGGREDQFEHLRRELEECQKKRDEYLNGWRRAKADFINYKKDEALRLEEVAKYSIEDLVKELINVLDSFDLGLAALEKEGRADKGIYMIKSQLEDILKKRGLFRIEVNKGEKFNPAFHEAIREVESDIEAGCIVEEIESGYKLFDKIIRPARVKVSKGKK